MAEETYLDLFDLNCLGKGSDEDGINEDCDVSICPEDPHKPEEDEDELNCKKVKDFLKMICKMMELFNLVKIRVTEKYVKLRDELEKEFTVPPKQVHFKYQHSKDFLYRFNTPYFKDKDGFPSLLNEDAKLRIKHGLMGYNSLITAGRIDTWSNNDRKKLCFSIREQLIEMKIEHLKRKEKYLKRTLKKDKNHLILIKNLQDQIEAIKSKTVAELMCKKDNQKIDWQRVSVLFDNYSDVDCRQYWHVFCKPSINKIKWNKDENTRLINLRRKYRYQNWEAVARELGTNRSPFQTFIHFQRKCFNKTEFYNQFDKWTPEKDKLLKETIKLCTTEEKTDWRRVAALCGRSIQQVFNRWKRFTFKSKVLKGVFTKKEDEKILDGVQEFGHDYFMIASLLKHRTAQQVKERVARLMPNETIGHWNPEEDNQLLELVNVHGIGNWSIIASALKIRNRTQIRQRYAVLENNYGANKFNASRRIKKDCTRRPTISSASAKLIEFFKQKYCQFAEIFLEDNLEYSRQVLCILLFLGTCKLLKFTETEIETNNKIDEHQKLFLVKLLNDELFDFQLGNIKRNLIKSRHTKIDKYNCIDSRSETTCKEQTLTNECSGPLMLTTNNYLREQYSIRENDFEGPMEEGPMDEGPMDEFVYRVFKLKCFGKNVPETKLLGFTSPNERSSELLAKPKDEENYTSNKTFSYVLPINVSTIIFLRTSELNKGELQCSKQNTENVDYFETNKSNHLKQNKKTNVMETQAAKLLRERLYAVLKVTVSTIKNRRPKHSQKKTKCKE